LAQTTKRLIYLIPFLIQIKNIQNKGILNKDKFITLFNFQVDRIQVNYYKVKEKFITLFNFQVDRIQIIYYKVKENNKTNLRKIINLLILK